MNVILLDNITKKLGDFYFKQLFFSVKKGYVTGLVGPNGSGKTSLISLITGHIQPDHGQVTIFDHKPHDLYVKQNVGIVLDQLYMYDDFTIHKMHHVIAPLYEQWNEEKFNFYLNKFNLPTHKKIQTFSKGMKMKCSLLFALSHEPKLLILDEPTAGLDPIFRKELLYIIQDLMVREEQTVLFSTHITTDLGQIADYITILDKGSIKLEGDMNDLKENLHIVSGPKQMIDQDVHKLFVHVEHSPTGFTGLYQGDLALFENLDEKISFEQAKIEDILYYVIKANAKDVMP